MIEEIRNSFNEEALNNRGIIQVKKLYLELKSRFHVM